METIGRVQGLRGGGFGSRVRGARDLGMVRVRVLGGGLIAPAS